MDAEKCFLEEFIDCYQSHTALWDILSSEYRNKRKKDAGYRELLMIFKKFKNSATLADVKRKINSLRCGYKREQRKIREAESAHIVYQSTLWWFNMMSFIQDFENPAVDNESIDNKNDLLDYEDTSESYREEKLFKPMRSTKIEPTTCNDCESESYENDMYDKEIYEINHNQFHHELGNRQANKSREERKRQKRHREIRHIDDKFDNLGKIWASKMRSLPRMQSILAEKAINDILFEAEIGQLEEQAVRQKAPPSPPFMCSDED